jgi:hypothetical protein
MCRHPWPAREIAGLPPGVDDLTIEPVAPADARSLLPYVAVAGLLVAAIAMRDANEPPPPPSADEIEGYLQRELDARVGAVLAWENERRSAIEAVADEPLVRDELARSEERSPDGDRLLARACRSLAGCALARPDGALLAATGIDSIPPRLVERAARGRTVHSRIMSSSDRYEVFFATPVIEAGRVRAVLAGRVHPNEELGAILGAHPPGRTTETYAVDHRGYMLTRSRFGARSEPPRVERLLRAPGGSIAAAHGADVDGYLDYRGVRVVGAWRWLDELGAAVVTEMDASEAQYQLAVR